MYLTKNGSATQIDLRDFLDNTDNQNLNLSNDTLYISKANNVYLPYIHKNNNGILIGTNNNQCDSASAGLLKYNPDTKKMQYCDGDYWLNVDGSFICGEQPLIDIRDSHIYITVRIGNQCWMAENLNYYIPTDSWCYDDSNYNCDIYGRLYTWFAMMNGESGTNNNPSNVRGICPDGWHLPSNAEWQELTDLLGGDSLAGIKLKESGLGHWASPNTGATNSTGFTALPGGVKRPLVLGGGFDSKYTHGIFWTTTIYNSSNSINRGLNYNSSNFGNGPNGNNHGFSVRCIMD